VYYHKRDKFWRLLVSFVVVMSAISCSIVSLAYAESDESEHTRIITVAYYEQAAHINRDNQDEYIGYNVDYLQKVASVANWEYEFIAFDSFDSAYQAIVAGEVDILPAVYKDQKREKEVLFSQSALCEMHVAISIREDDDRFAYEDYEALRDKKIGLVEGSYDTELFLEFSQEQGIEAELVYYQDLNALVEDLRAAKIDAIATDYLGSGAGLRVMSQFYLEPLYFAISPDNESLKEDLDNVIEEVLLREPAYFVSLFEKYFGTDTTQDPLFTSDENEYLQTAHLLRVAYVSSRAPISYADPDTGEYAGVTANLFADISRITGLEFEYREYESHSKALEAVSVGEADIVYMVDSTSAFKLDYLSPTSSFCGSYMTRVSGSNEESDAIALVHGFPLEDEVLQENPGKTIRYYDWPKECLDAVLEGQASLTYVETNIGNYLLSEAQYESLSSVIITSMPTDMCIGVSYSADPRLRSILDRCVQFTSESTVSKWIANSLVAAHPTTMIDFIRQNSLMIIAGLIVFFLLAGTGLGLLMQARARNKARISELSYADPLTKGWNLARFQSHAEELLQSEGGKRYAVLYFDISRFKSFNAECGYSSGDKLLMGISEKLVEFIRNEECFARITADEFVVLVEWEGWNYFQVRFGVLDKWINELDVLKTNNYRVIILGGVCVVAGQSDSYESMVAECIDSARYARESIGEVSQSFSALYNNEMREHDLAEQKLLNEAKVALNNGEFVAYYQPKVLIKAGEIKTFEALVRWQTSDGTLRSPGEFIPLFERNGFIATVDMQVFRLVCERLQRRMKEGKSIVPIACNFSRLHFRDHTFPDRMKRIIDEYGVSPSYLELEMTESIVMEDFAGAQAICGRLKELGFSISIDDFGSGYSSLGTLQKFDFDVLKIDRSLLISSQESERNMAILEGTIQIAGKMGAAIVVEGVEEVEQAQMLLELDDDIIAQGFLYSRPLNVIDSDKQLDKGFIAP